MKAFQILLYAHDVSAVLPNNKLYKCPVFLTKFLTGMDVTFINIHAYYSYFTSRYMSQNFCSPSSLLKITSSNGLVHLTPTPFYSPPFIVLLRRKNFVHILYNYSCFSKYPNHVTIMSPNVTTNLTVFPCFFIFPCSESFPTLLTLIPI